MTSSLEKMGYLNLKKQHKNSFNNNQNKENMYKRHHPFTPFDECKQSSKMSKVCSTPLSPAKRTLFNPFRVMTSQSPDVSGGGTAGGRYSLDVSEGKSLFVRISICL